MPKEHKPREGSLQFWPRKRAKRILPRVNWKALEEKYENEEVKPLGILGYKVGMESVIVRDERQHSLTKGQEIFMPVSIIEIPPQKILSIRFYKKNMLLSETMLNVVDEYRWIKRKIKAMKKSKSKEELLKEIEDKAQNADKIRLIVYTKPKMINLKKTPDIAEIGLSGSIEKQLEFVKENIDKDISSIALGSTIKQGMLIDVRGVTKAKGLQGPVKRFGIKLKQHKSEKGRRRPGSIGSWNPSKVIMSAPLAGQLGFFTRTEYNKYVIDVANIKEKNINKKGGFWHYGLISGNFLMLKGTVVGPSKRQLILTLPLRPSKSSLKQSYRFVNLNYETKK